MKLSYDVFNATSSLPPILFLHGMADWRQTWKLVAPEIARRTQRQAYVLDARNHGSSPRSPQLNYDVLDQDLLDFMNDHRIRLAVIVGHSMGGRMAINFGLRHPDRTQALIIEDMTPKDVDSGPSSFVAQFFNVGFDFLSTFPADMALETCKRTLADLIIVLLERFVDTNKIRKNIDQIADLLPITKIGDTFGPVANIDAVLAMVKENPLVQHLPECGLKYEGDALFLYGSKPFFDLGEDSSILKLFPRARLKRIIGSSHYIHIDNAEVFIQEVSDFILSSNLSQSKY